MGSRDTLRSDTAGTAVPGLDLSRIPDASAAAPRLALNNRGPSMYDNLTMYFVFALPQNNTYQVLFFTASEENSARFWAQFGGSSLSMRHEGTGRTAACPRSYQVNVQPEAGRPTAVLRHGYVVVIRSTPAALAFYSHGNGWTGNNPATFPAIVRQRPWTIGDHGASRGPPGGAAARCIRRHLPGADSTRGDTAAGRRLGSGRPRPALGRSAADTTVAATVDNLRRKWNAQ